MSYYDITKADVKINLHNIKSPFAVCHGEQQEEHGVNTLQQHIQLDEQTILNVRAQLYAAAGLACRTVGQITGSSLLYITMASNCPTR